MFNKKKNKVFRICKETAVQDLEHMNEFLLRTSGKVETWGTVNEYRDQEYMVEY